MDEIPPKKNNRRPPPGPGPGRDPDLTPELQEKICEKIRRGNYIETAVRACGIHKTTYYRWLKRAKEERGSIYEAFRDATDKAEAFAEERDVNLIDLAAHGAKALYDEKGNKVRDEVKRDPKMAAWRLARKHPKRWGRTEKIEHTGKNGGPMTFTDFIKHLGAQPPDGEEDDTE